MCLSIPMRVTGWEGTGEFAWVEREGRRECVNMMLLGLNMRDGIRLSAMLRRESAWKRGRHPG